MERRLGWVLGSLIAASAGSLGCGSAPMDSEPTSSTGDAVSTSQMLKVVGWAQAAGVPCGSKLALAGAIAAAESGLSVTAVGYNGPTAGCPSGSQDRGLWQINNCYNPSVSTSCAFDGACNARAMASISGKGSDWQPWSTYTEGRYYAYLSIAEGAAKLVCGPQAPGNQTPAKPSCGAIAAKQGLTKGQALFSCNKAFSLTLTSTGNLVLAEASGPTLWATDTAGSNAYEVEMQADGNFLLADSKGNFIWETNTSDHPGAMLLLEDDGNLSLNVGDTVYWSSSNKAQAKGFTAQAPGLAAAAGSTAPSPNDPPPSIAVSGEGIGGCSMTPGSARSEGCVILLGLLLVARKRRTAQA